MARSSLDGAKAANCLQRESVPDEKTIQCPVAARAAGSLPELINQRGRSLIQIIERIQPTMIGAGDDNTGGGLPGRALKSCESRAYGK
jgi:hypothetical protein